MNICASPVITELTGADLRARAKFDKLSLERLPDRWQASRPPKEHLCHVDLSARSLEPNWIKPIVQVAQLLLAPGR